MLGRLPVVLAGDTGTIPFRYHAGLSNRGHRYNHNLARVDSAPGAADGCSMHFINILGHGLVTGYVNEVTTSIHCHCYDHCMTTTLQYCTILHITTFYNTTKYYEILRPYKEILHIANTYRSNATQYCLNTT